MKSRAPMKLLMSTPPSTPRTTPMMMMMPMPMPTMMQMSTPSTAPIFDRVSGGAARSSSGGS